MKKFFKSSEEIVSMFLGLVIIAVIAGMAFNFVTKRNSGSIPESNGSVVSENSENVSEQNVYTVLENDSLWKIAEKQYGSGYKWIEIAKENKIENAGVIFKGQKIILPKIEMISGSTIEKGEYVVKKGDSLWKISVRAYSDGYQWTKIWQVNKNVLINPNKLEIGMKLMIE